MADNKDNHYIDNQRFFEEMVAWKKKCKQAEEDGLPKPPINNYIGECFILIATKLSHKSNFITYPYREEMVSDGIENCLQYCSNFDPEISNNPFSYFTQIIYFAFLRRIQKEKKQTYIKYKLLEQQDKDGSVRRGISNSYDREENLVQTVDDLVAKHFDLSNKEIKDLDMKTEKKKKVSSKVSEEKNTSDGCTLDTFFS